MKYVEPPRKENPRASGNPFRRFLSILLLALVLLSLAGFTSFSKGDGVDLPGAGGGCGRCSFFRSRRGRRRCRTRPRPLPARGRTGGRARLSFRRRSTGKSLLRAFEEDIAQAKRLPCKGELIVDNWAKVSSIVPAGMAEGIQGELCTTCQELALVEKRTKKFVQRG